MVFATLVVGRDFGNLFFNADVKKSWGRPRKEKIITFEVAKRIGLLSKTPAGDRIRRYFLDCECRMMNNLGPPDPAATTIAHEAHTHESRPIIDHGGANHLPVGMAEFLEQYQPDWNREAILG